LVDLQKWRAAVRGVKFKSNVKGWRSKDRRYKVKTAAAMRAVVRAQKDFRGDVCTKTAKG
jgi:hypothetical protein